MAGARAGAVFLVRLRLLLLLYGNFFLRDPKYDYDYDYDDYDYDDYDYDCDYDDYDYESMTMSL